MRPDATVMSIADLIERVRRRRRHVDAMEALALAIAASATTLWVTAGFSGRWIAWSTAVIVGVLVGVGVFARRRHAHTALQAALAIERLRPQSRNLVVTAEELTRHPERASAWMRERVDRDATRVVGQLTPWDVVTAKRGGALTVAALGLATAVILVPNARDTARVATSVGTRVADAILGRSTWTLHVTIQPPAYTRRNSETVIDPERLEVLEGTRLALSGRGAASRRVRFGTTALGLLSQNESLVHIARDSGYFAIEAPDGATRLVALSVVRDRTPSVKLEQPARDLLLPDASRAVPVQVIASDDLGLTALELRYTKVSGSGENFEFQEGTLPLAVTRTSAREWRAQTQLALASLNLSPGDSLVYRALARDARAGDTGLGMSDTFFVEIAGPGQVPLEGIEMPPEEERYALSQQMIVLKVERLKAREKGMSREAVGEETALLAAEQRSVRANFIFLLGGHVEDEEEEAEQSSEIAEGRLQNTARRDIAQAIGHMTRAEQALVAVSTGTALPPARSAVDALQRAFGRSRYLLRSLASRSRLDPSRRLTGNIASADDWRRIMLAPSPREGHDVRALLADVLAAYAALSAGSSSSLGVLAERALAIDPASRHWQEVAQRIQRADEQRAQPAAARKLLEPVIADLAGATSAGLVPASGLSTPQSLLERAWRDGGSR